MDRATITQRVWPELPRRRRVTALLAAAWCALALTLPGAAQEPAASGDGIKLQETTTGVGRYVRGAWGIRGADVSNYGDEPVEVVADVAFDGDPLTEYARRAWIPAHSRRRLSIPVLPPADGTHEILARTWLYRAADDSRTPLTPPDESRSESERLARAQPPVTVMVADWDDPEPASLSLTREMVVALRLAAGDTRNLTELSAADIPAFSWSLEAADEIVLASNHIADSPAALATLGAWLQRGGRLWIPLDQVELRTVEQLLSDAVHITGVDRVRLSEVDLLNLVKGIPSGPARTHEDPVDMVRVIVPNVSVIHEVDGWPASFWLMVGDGQVLFTTLAAPAWMRPRLPHEQVEQLERNSSYIAETGLDELATLMTRPLDPPPLTEADFAEYLSGDVGLRIPARGTVLSILGLFWAVWLAIGYRLLRTARLERLAVVGPLLAFLTAAPLAVLGHQLRKTTPPTAALAEFVQVGAGAAAVHTTGAATLFVPEPTEAEISAVRGRLLIPRRDRLDGSLRQLQWTDLDDWHWASLTLPTGVQAAATEQHVSLTTPVRTVATFGPDGIHGRLETGAYLAPSDLLIATAASQQLAVRMQADGSFTAGRAEVLEPGSYLAGALLTDVQRRRNAIYERLLHSRRESRYPQRPTLLAWMRPAETGLQIPDTMQQSATALVATPLEFTPPPAGTTVYIPAPLLTYNVTNFTDGLQSTVYDARTAQWQKSSSAVDVVLRFRLPDAVLPLAPERAELSLKIRAPLRTIELATGSATDPVPLSTQENPDGRFTFPLTAAEAMRIDEAGGLHVRLRVGELKLQNTDPAAMQGADRTWRLETITLELTGRAGQRTTEGEVRE